MNGSTASLRACKRCEFFVADASGTGHCRRNPPTGFILMQQNLAGQVNPIPTSAWPPVQADAWCGEFSMLMGAAIMVGEAETVTAN